MERERAVVEEAAEDAEELLEAAGARAWLEARAGVQPSGARVEGVAGGSAAAQA
jgi:hypothetical protein